MFTKWIFTHNIIIILLLYSETTCAVTNTNNTNVMKYAGIVENITVHVLKDESYANDHNALKLLRLNVSWIPPKEGKEPSSYSVIVTSIPRENDTKEECTEGSGFYSVPNKSPFSLLVPRNKDLNSISEVQIHPNCTYRIQVHANPRAKPVGQLPEVIYTVPECIDRKCSCVAATLNLPVPKVEMTQVEESIIVNWNVTSNSSYIQSYVISIGVPLLISNAGHPVYNITRITNVTSTTNTFIWDSKIDDQYVDIKSGYKIFVAAMDHRGCSGTQGGVTVNVNRTTLQGNIIYFLLTGVTICVILGFIIIMSVYKKNKHRLVWQTFPLRKQSVPEYAFKLNQWPHLEHQKFNISLYKEQKSGEAHCSKTQTDKFEISYECINLIRELGRGQFGTVYLGSLNNNKDTLVAVKMSQCQDVYDESEARCQLLEEIRIMKTAGSHPNLVSFIGCCTSLNTPVCILLEYMKGGDLLAYLHSKRNIESDNVLLCTFERIVSRYANIIGKDKNKDGNLYSAIEKQQFLQFALDVARGMEHLEAAKITHRDLAARNILLTSDLTLKISDFGLSRNGVYIINNNMSKVRRLPLRWMSPEAVRDYAFSTKSDVWSFGVVLWEIGTLGSFPYATIPDDELMHYLIQSKCRLACPETISPDIYKIMCSCWDTMSQNRPTFAQLVSDLQKLKEPIHSVFEQNMYNPCYTLLSD